jgi:hypothetical protein
MDGRYLFNPQRLLDRIAEAGSGSECPIISGVSNDEEMGLVRGKGVTLGMSTISLGTITFPPPVFGITVNINNVLNKKKKL